MDTTRPIPGTLRSRLSFSRQTGLSQISQLWTHRYLREDLQISMATSFLVWPILARRGLVRPRRLFGSSQKGAGTQAFLRS
jgi:hypothetical protein